MTESRIKNNLADLRSRHQLSAAALAEAVGVTRQTIYAIENGSFVPNTAVALRLAMILQTSVEDLFRLEEPEQENADVALLPGAEELQVGQPVQLCRVGKHTVAIAPSVEPVFLPMSDAVAVSGRRVRMLNPEEKRMDNRVLVAGCDPALSILARHAANAGVQVMLAHCNSTQALQLLRDGLIHVAGTHLNAKGMGVPRSMVVPFAVWEQGIVSVKPVFKEICDLARKGVRYVNRELGSGTRALLDGNLQTLGIQERQIHGYKTIAAGHMAAAWSVKSGAADCCIATRSVANHFGLRFAPLVSERYDFVVLRRNLKLPAIETLFNVLSDAAFRREVGALGGYQLS